MYKKKIMVLFLVLSLGSVTLLGCQTTKGIAQGMGYTIEGAAKDTRNLWQAILKADSWIREYLW